MSKKQVQGEKEKNHFFKEKMILKA